MVTATDGAGQAHERVLEFDTRAAFLLSYYSPLTVTALDDCDTLGKGDFELTWQNDTSLPLGKTSTFKLGKGESYQEDGLRTAVNPVYYGESPVLFEVDGEPEFFYVTITENDPGGARVLAVWKWDFPITFEGAPGPRDPFFTRGPVAQLGDHQYPVTMTMEDVESGGGDDCRVRMEFTVYLAMMNPVARP